MTQKKKSKSYIEKYFAVLNKFGVTPNFKFSDIEKDIIKYIDEESSVSTLTFYDKYDLKPSEAKEILDELEEKGAVKVIDGTITLTTEAIKYIHTSKEQRKSEKKFRKFVDALNEKDLDEFMKLVESFVVKPEPIKKPRAPGKTTARKPVARRTTRKPTTRRTVKKEVVNEVKPVEEVKKED